MRRLLFLLSFAPLLPAQNWTEWKPDLVFPGIEVRARCGALNEFARGPVWDVQLRNTYQKNVDLAWTAEPERIVERAPGIAPGQVLETHYPASGNCSTALTLRVNDVRNAAAAPHPVAAGIRPKLEGRWRSKDPEPFQKELVIQLDGRTVISHWSSPAFSFTIATPLPENMTGSVSLK